MPINAQKEIDGLCIEPWDDIAYVLCPYLHLEMNFGDASISNNGDPVRQNSLIDVISHYADPSRESAKWVLSEEKFETHQNNVISDSITIKFL